MRDADTCYKHDLVIYEGPPNNKNCPACKLETENAKLEARVAELEKELKDFATDVAYQWGSWQDKDGKRHLGDMGLSTLEEAFDIAGLVDGQPVDQETGQALEAEDDD